MSDTVGSTTLSVAQMPIHGHKIPASWDDSQGHAGEIPPVTRYLNNSDSAGTGGSLSHTHTLSGAS